MRRPGPLRQQGFGLLSFLVVTVVVVLTLVLGYSGILTRKAANDLRSNQIAYLQESADRIESMWTQFAGQLDRVGGGSSVTAADVTRLAGINLRHGAQVALSDVLTIPAEGVSYRVVALYLPAETDSVNPPDIAQFQATGVFQSCIAADEECGERVVHVFSSLELERGMLREAQLRLNKVASKAQSYFKARMLQDVERNIDINYFRDPSGECEVQAMDLPCWDVYEPLSTMAPLGGLDRTRMADILALTDEELFSPWGDPIEASNLLDSETEESPFTMSFQLRTPAGDTMRITAVQQL